MTVYEAIAAPVQYGMDTGLTPECERIYTTNQLLEIMQLMMITETETTAAMFRRKICTLPVDVRADVTDWEA